MFSPLNAFSGFSVDDLDTARAFYAQTLGLDVTPEGVGLALKLPGGGNVFVYAKGAHHTPASFTILNFEVPNLEAAVDALVARGVTFERYPGMTQDERAISRGGPGPNIAWFTDPAKNVLALIQA
jgi:catechol 2,3-dioxygenase-like lactoylglutathione lyase family enzyme